MNHSFVDADGVRVFYRHAGQPGRPAILLLHGFPTSSHMFRDLIPLLAEDHYVVAPDLPGFGFTEVPDERKYRYNFESLARTVGAFVDAIGLTKFALYVFDYGAPVGFRLALSRPDQVTGIVSQNGNAYEEGLSAAWNPIQRYWSDPTEENRAALAAFLTLDATRMQYTHGTPVPEAVAPEAYTLDAALLARPGNREIQLDLFLDYSSNVKLYPKFQEYLRRYQPRLLAIWGRNDPFFLPAGAEAYRRDVPSAEVRLLDTGHFALETHAAAIAAAMREVLPSSLAARR